MVSCWSSLELLKGAVFTLAQIHIQQGEGNEKDLLYSSLSKVKYIKQIPFYFK